MNTSDTPTPDTPTAEAVAAAMARAAILKSAYENQHLRKFFSADEEYLMHLASALTAAQARELELQQAVAAASANEQDLASRLKSATARADVLESYLNGVAEAVEDDEEGLQHKDIEARARELRKETAECRKFISDLTDSMEQDRNRICQAEQDRNTYYDRAEAAEAKVAELESQLREANDRADAAADRIESAESAAEYARWKQSESKDSSDSYLSYLCMMSKKHAKEFARAEAAESALTAERQKVAELEVKVTELDALVKKVSSDCDERSRKEREWRQAAERTHRLAQAAEQHRERLEAALRTIVKHHPTEYELKHLLRFSSIAGETAGAALAQSQPAPAIASSAQASSSGAERREAPAKHCEDCDPSFTCWDGSQKCRKHPAETADAIPASITVTKCSVSGAWYADRIGEAFTPFARDRYGFWVRTGDAYNTSNWIKPEDCEPTQSANSPDSLVVKREVRDGESWSRQPNASPGFDSQSGVFTPSGAAPAAEPCDKRGEACPLPACITVTRCSVSGAWYADQIGRTFAPFAMDRYGYWVRTGDAYNTSNWIKPEDCEPAPAAQKGAE